MANERVELTIALNDQISDTLHRVSTQFEGLSRRVKETGDQGSTHFRRVGDEINNIHRGLGNVNTGLGSMSTLMKSMLLEFNKQLGGSLSRLPEFSGAMGAVAVSASNVALSLGGIVGGLGLIVGTAGAVVGSIYAIGRAVTNSYQNTINLRLELGENNDVAIRHARRVGEVLGMAPGQTDQILKQMTGLILDSTRGTSSDLAMLLNKLANTGRGLAEHMRVYMLQGHTAMEGFDEFYREVAKGSEDFQRRVAAAINQPYWYVHQQAEASRNTPKGYAPSAEDQAKLDQYRARVQAVSNDLKHAIQDQINAGWDQLALKALPYLEKALTLMNQFVHSEAWEKIRDFIGRRFEDFFTNLKNLYDTILPIYQLLSKYAGKSTEDLINEHREQQEKDAKSGRGWKWPWQKQSGEGGMPAPTLIGMSGTGMMGGEPIVLRDISTEGKESNVYLRDIRDIMAWMRDQQGGGTGEGGTGPGGAKVWNASLGGGNAPGMGASPGPGGTGPNTNPPGTGSGGTPGGPGGPSGPPGTGPGGVPAATTLGPYGKPMPPWGTTVTGPEDFGGGIGKGVAGDVPGLPGSPSGRSLTRDERRAAAGGIEPGGAGGGGGGGGVPTAGGSAYLAKQRAALFADLDKNPQLQKEVAAVIGMEEYPGEGSSDLLESMVNRAISQGKTSLSQVVHSRFYAGVNHGLLPGKVAGLGPAEMKEYERAVAAVRGGRNVLEGRTNQGNWGDWQKPGEYTGGMIHPRGKGRGDYYGWFTAADRAKTEADQRRMAEYDRTHPGDEPRTPSSATAGAGSVTEGPYSGSRRFPIGEQTREQLEYASAVTGLTAHVFSGTAQAGTKGARSGRHAAGSPYGAGDLYLTDAEGKRVGVDDPRLQRFMLESVRAGAHGVGAGHGYMEGGDFPEGAIHIGGGRGAPAYWGRGERTVGAPDWLKRTFEEGRRTQISRADQRTVVAREQQKQQQAAAEQNRRKLDQNLAESNDKKNIGAARVQIDIGEGKQEKSAPNDEGMIPINLNLPPQMSTPDSGRRTSSVGQSANQDIEE